MPKDVEHLKLFTTICISFFRNSVLSSICVWLGGMFFWYLIFWIIYMIQTLTSIRCLAGNDFSYFVGCFFTQVVISFAVSKYLHSMRLLLALIPMLLGSYSEGMFLCQWVPLYSLIFSSIRLRVRGLRSLFHLELNLV